jgi:hypothetical protein
VGNVYSILFSKSERKRLLWNVIVAEKIILLWIFKYKGGGKGVEWSGFMWLRIRTSGWVV